MIRRREDRCCSGSVGCAARALCRRPIVRPSVRHRRRSVVRRSLSAAAASLSPRCPQRLCAGGGREPVVGDMFAAKDASQGYTPCTTLYTRLYTRHKAI
jgi:hypothetical protein